MQNSSAHFMFESVSGMTVMDFLFDEPEEAVKNFFKSLRIMYNLSLILFLVLNLEML